MCIKTDWSLAQLSLAKYVPVSPIHARILGEQLSSNLCPVDHDAHRC